MTIFKTDLKISLISVLLLSGSIATTAWADHNSHSILPYIAVGVFATILHHNSHSHSYKTKRMHSHSTHYGHSNHYGHSGHSIFYYQHNQHSYSSGGYHHKQKRH